jgi:hypothetical protein
VTFCVRLFIKKTVLLIGKEVFICQDVSISNIESFCTQFNSSCMYKIEIKNVYTYIQGVSEIGALILTGNRTRQKEQLFYLPFCRKTMFNSKKKLERFFTKITLRH